MPKKKAKKKKEENNKIFWLIGILVIVLTIVILAFFSLDKKEGEETKEEISVMDVVDVGNCPEEFHKQKIQIYPRDKGEDAFPNRLNIYEADFIKNKGNYVGICSVGADNAEKITYVLCTNQTPYPNYIRMQEISENGKIIPQERWFVDITFDYTTCKKYGVIPTSKLDLYECNLISVECSKP